MKFTTATIAACAIVAAASSASAQCVDPIVDTGCTLRTMTMFAVKSVFGAPLAIIDAAEETFDSVAGAFCGEPVCFAPTCAPVCKPACKPAKKVYCAKPACVATPSFTDYVFGAPLGLVIGPFKYGVAGAEEGVTKGYCAARGNWLLAPLAAYPAAAFYGAVGAVKGLLQGPFIGGPCGWANMRCCCQPFQVYMR